MGFAYDYLTRSSPMLNKYGLDNPFQGMGEDIQGLERVASRGLDPNEFGKRYGAQASAGGRQIVGQTNTALGGAALGLGENMLSGSTQRIQAAGAGTRMSMYGELLGRLRSEDWGIKSEAKAKLMSLIMARQQVESALVMQEESLRVKSGG